MHSKNICITYTYSSQLCMKNETTYQMVLGRLIAEKRKERQLDQEAIAQQVGVNRSTWSRIEAGASALNIDQLARTASALETSLGDLMQEADEIVEQLKRQNVDVYDSREQANMASAKRGANVAVAFLGGAVLGGIIATMLGSQDGNDKTDSDD